MNNWFMDGTGYAPDVLNPLYDDDIYDVLGDVHNYCDDDYS